MIRNFIWGSGPPVYIQPLRISGLPVTPVPKADICALLGCILTSCPAVKYHRPLNCPTLEIAVSLNADEIIRLPHALYPHRRRPDRRTRSPPLPDQGRRLSGRGRHFPRRRHRSRRVPRLRRRRDGPQLHPRHHLLLQNTSVSENRTTGEKSPTVHFID